MGDGAVMPCVLSSACRLECHRSKLKPHVGTISGSQFEVGITQLLKRWEPRESSGTRRTQLVSPQKPKLALDTIGCTLPPRACTLEHRFRFIQEDATRPVRLITRRRDQCILKRGAERGDVDRKARWCLVCRSYHVLQKCHHDRTEENGLLPLVALGGGDAQQPSNARPDLLN